MMPFSQGIGRLAAIVDGKEQAPDNHADNEMVHPRCGNTECSEGRQPSDNMNLRHQVRRAIEDHEP